MSLYGAVRMFIEGGRPADGCTPTGGRSDELQPIRPGAWRAWSRAQALEDAREHPMTAAVGQRGAARDGHASSSVGPIGGAMRVQDAEIARGGASTQPRIEPL